MRLVAKSTKAESSDATFHASIAHCLRELRRRAGLKQSEVAALLGTQPSVISRMERPDYRGHSLRFLVQIAAALDARLVLRFENHAPLPQVNPDEPPQHPGQRRLFAPPAAVPGGRVDRAGR